MTTPRILRFYDNYIQEYLLDDGVSMRVVEYEISGIDAYSFSPRDPIYNAADDCIYVQGTKNASPITVKFDARTLAIVAEDDLSAYGTLYDVQGEHIWTVDYPDIYALSTVDFSVAYTGTGLYSSYSQLNQAAPGGRLVAVDGTDYFTPHLLTITSPTTVSDDPITIPTLTTGNYPYANTSGYQRPYIATGDKMCIYTDGNDSAVLAVIVDLGALTATVVPQTVSPSYGSTFGPRWDAAANVIAMVGEDNDTFYFAGVIIDVEGAVVTGATGNDGNYSDVTWPLGDGRLVMFGNDDSAGLFDASVPTMAPNTVLTSSSMTTTNAGYFNWAFGLTIVPGGFSSFWHEFIVSTETA